MASEQVVAARLTKRQRIEQFFRQNPGERFTSSAMHSIFGSAFRSRVSDINRDISTSLVIRNETTEFNGEERSVYWGEHVLTGVTE